MYRPRFYDYGKRWKRLIDHLKKIGIEKAEKAVFKKSPTKEASHKVTTDETAKETRLTSESYKITTKEQLYQYLEINPLEYVEDRVMVNKWEGFLKNEDGEAETVQMFQIKIWLKPATRNVIHTLETIENELISHLNSTSPSIPVPTIRNSKRSLLLEPVIADLHVGKRVISDDGKMIWNKDKALKAYNQIIGNIISRVETKRIQRIVLPVGNDLINVDSRANTTTAGTPQMTGNYYEHLIADTEILLFENIKKLSQIAPVDVLLIPGNHDFNSVYHVGRSVLAYFKNDQNVSIQNPTGRSRNYYRFKKVLLGFTHGHNEKADKLPFIAAAEVPAMWGATEYREFHIGHFHHSKRRVYSASNRTDTIGGMTIRYMPTVCPADRWHKEKGYVGSFRRSLSLVFSADRLEDVHYFNV